MADDVVVYWVTKNGTIYAADMVSRTYIGISSMERLDAARRALDFAGIPHKDWGRGEPATMEEFGTPAVTPQMLESAVRVQVVDLLRNPEFAKIPLDTLRANQIDVLRAPEFSNGAKSFAVIIDTESGAWYAVAPGRFWHLRDFVEVNALRAAGVLSAAGSEAALSHADTARVRELALRGNDELLPPTAPVPPATYTVKAGDTFNAIAKSLGVTPDALAAANPQVTNRENINEGQVLNVPPK